MKRFLWPALLLCALIGLLTWAVRRSVATNDPVVAARLAYSMGDLSHVLAVLEKVDNDPDAFLLKASTLR